MTNQNFLADYVSYSSGNEAHPNYHLWGGLMALAAIMSRRVWLDFEHFTLKPNIYAVLLGPPGSKKNTAIDLCTGFLHKVNGADPNLIPFAADCGSKEKLVKELAASQRKFTTKDGVEHTHAPLNIFATELSQFLGTQTAAHMLDFMTTVYSQDRYVRSTILHDREVILGPCVNMLAATVPEWITNYLKADVITGGFSRRVVFIYETEEGEPIPFPTITDEQRAAYDRMLVRASCLLGVSGAFTWSPEARAFFIEWYTHHQKTLPKDPNLQFYYRTRWTQIMKVAMFVSLSCSDSLMLTKDDILTAIAIMEKTERNLSKVFVGMGRNELSALSNKVVEILTANQGPMLEKQVKSILFTHAGGREQWEILEHLVESEKVFRVKAEKDGIEKVYLFLPEHLEQAKMDGRRINDERKK